MRRPWFIPLVLLALVGALAWLASSRVAAERGTTAGALALAATVRANVVTVTAPRLAGGGASAASASQPTVAGRVASVESSEGDRVEAGEVVVRFDDTALALRVDQARAAARAARARIGIADANLDTLADKASQLADTRRTVDSALRQLRTSRAEVVANLAQARALAASAPATLPPGAPNPRALVAKLEAALAQIDAGIAKATAGRAKIESGAAKLADARSTLRGARGVLSLAANAADVGVEVADARRTLAEVRAPYAGTVTWIAERGSVIFAGGPVALLAPDGPLLLDAFVDGGQAKSVKVGARAEAGADSWPGRSFPGIVTAIRPAYEYPPTTLPTRLVHMTRAFQVTVTIDDAHAPLPPGTPADLTIATRSE